MKPQKHIQWIVIANASRARILERQPDRPAALVHSLRHEESRQHSSVLGDDRAGNQVTGRGFGAAALGPRTDAQHKEMDRFAREVAQTLEDAALAHRMHAVVVFASSHFLGMLRERMGQGTRRLLQASVNLDLSSLSNPEIDHRVSEALQRVRPGLH